MPGFLVVVAGTIPQLGFVGGVVTFVIYGFGMSALLLVVTLALASGEHALVGRLRRSSRYVDRIAGGILVVAGSYIVVFWAATLSGDGTAQIAPVTWAEQLSSIAANLVTGAPMAIGDVAGLVIAGTALWVWSSRRRPSDAPDRVTR